MRSLASSIIPNFLLIRKSAQERAILHNGLLAYKLFIIVEAQSIKYCDTSALKALLNGAIMAVKALPETRQKLDYRAISHLEIARFFGDFS